MGYVRYVRIRKRKRREREKRYIASLLLSKQRKIHIYIARRQLIVKGHT